MEPSWNKYDNAYKFLFSHKKIFLQFLQSFINFDFVKNLNESNLELIDKSFVSEEFISRESDIIYKISLAEREFYILFLLEFQSTPDKTFPVRIALYTLQLYDSIFRNSQKGLLPAIFPTVLYNGSNDWNIPVNISDLIEKTIPIQYIPSIEYFPLIEKDIHDDVLKQLHNLIAAVFYLEKRKKQEELQEAINEVLDYIKTEDIFNIRVFAVWLKRMFRQQVTNNEIKKIDNYLGVKAMITTLAEAIEKKGIEKGIEKGIKKTAKRMKNEGFAIDQIQKVTGLTRKEIEKL